MPAAYTINENQGNSTQPDQIRGLVAACIREERPAQKAFYDRYSPQVYGIIRRFTPDDQTAGHILNEVFFKILTRLEQYHFQGPIEGWMRRIAVNVLTDHYRSSKRHRSQELTADAEDVGVHHDATAGLSYKELLLLIQNLPDTQRAVFNLFVFEDLSHKDIALHLNITENNSRWHLNDARRRLKEKIIATR